MLSLSGWSDSTEKYSQMLNDDNHRANVVGSISNFMGTYGFLGCDVDIEYPNAYQVSDNIFRTNYFVEKYYSTQTMAQFQALTDCDWKSSP